jgi:hypothetical protein
LDLQDSKKSPDEKKDLLPSPWETRMRETLPATDKKDGAAKKDLNELMKDQTKFVANK